jgi:hypothetical protein
MTCGNVCAISLASVTPVCAREVAIATRQKAARRPHNSLAPGAVGAVPVALDLRRPRPHIPTRLGCPYREPRAEHEACLHLHEPILALARRHACASHRGLRSSVEHDSCRGRRHIERSIVTPTRRQQRERPEDQAATTVAATATGRRPVPNPRRLRCQATGRPDDSSPASSTSSSSWSRRPARATAAPCSRAASIGSRDATRRSQASSERDIRAIFVS